jgi:hypothetical protein
MRLSDADDEVLIDWYIHSIDTSARQLDPPNIPVLSKPANNDASLLLFYMLTRWIGSYLFKRSNHFIYFHGPLVLRRRNLFCFALSFAFKRAVRRLGFTAN